MRRAIVTGTSSRQVHYRKLEVEARTKLKTYSIMDLISM
jgi:hypothetical protein